MTLVAWLSLTMTLVHYLEPLCHVSSVFDRSEAIVSQVGLAWQLLLITVMDARLLIG